MSPPVTGGSDTPASGAQTTKTKKVASSSAAFLSLRVCECSPFSPPISSSSVRMRAEAALKHSAPTCADLPPSATIRPPSNPLPALPSSVLIPPSSLRPHLPSAFSPPPSRARIPSSINSSTTRVNPSSFQAPPLPFLFRSRSPSRRKPLERCLFFFLALPPVHLPAQP
eukprot:2035940-Rhodomonas_salina.3